MAVDVARQVLAEAVRARTFPCAAAELGDSEGPIWTDCVGTRTFEDSAPIPIGTLFDLASLTKPVATASVVLALVDAGLLGLQDRLRRFFPEWRGVDRDDATISDLLEHASGLPARLVDRPPQTRREFEHEICRIPLEYPRRTRSIYSDLGFILLGFLVSDVGAAPLDAAFSRLWSDPLLAFRPGRELRERAAPTLPLAEDPRRGRRLVGEVHDNYADALGGVAGHAGLFGTSASVGRFARMLLRMTRDGDWRGSDGNRPPFSADRLREMTVRSSVPGSSRALGWDTMLPTSSCGTRMSTAAFGHVGFTGTSLWIDPVRDRYFVLLTNRVCGGGTIDEMRQVRRAFHDALADG
jgi:CubicO group peptidase (beta-lactamase class C family)